MICADTTVDSFSSVSLWTFNSTNPFHDVRVTELKLCCCFLIVFFCLCHDCVSGHAMQGHLKPSTSKARTLSTPPPPSLWRPGSRPCLTHGEYNRRDTLRILKNHTSLLCVYECPICNVKCMYISCWIAAYICEHPKFLGS